MTAGFRRCTPESCKELRRLRSKLIQIDSVLPHVMARCIKLQIAGVRRERIRLTKGFIVGCPVIFPSLDVLWILLPGDREMMHLHLHPMMSFLYLLGLIDVPIWHHRPYCLYSWRVFQGVPLYSSTNQGLQRGRLRLGTRTTPACWSLPGPGR